MTEIIPAYCYVARAGGLTKVGFSFNPEHRMTILERPAGGKPELKFSLKFNPYHVAYNAEALTKGFLARYLVAGEEWFDVDADHAIDVMIASGERAVDAHNQRLVVDACNDRYKDTALIDALGLREYVEAREYPVKWLKAREAALTARRQIRAMSKAMKAA